MTHLINSKSIIDQLHSQYQVECVISIEELEQSSSSFLYKKLIPLYQSSYSSQQRFVFVNSAPVDRKTLDHVIATLNYIDISPYFILVVTNQESTATYFRSLPGPITVIESLEQTDHVQHNVLKTKPLFNTDNKMCAHVWAGLHVNPGGTTKFCCEYLDMIKDEQGNSYNIKNTPIEIILNSEYVKKVKQQFRQGTTPDACRRCSTKESLGADSKRSLTPYKLKNIYGNIDWESDTADSLGWIGGHLGNVCNLKCRMCSEIYSSTIAAEKIKFSTFKNKKQDPVYAAFSNSWKNYIEEFYSDLKKLVPRIKNFEFSGGEPLMMQENLDFMQYLIDAGHSEDCIFEFLTNGTKYPDVFNQSHLFKRLSITLSIDNLGKRFEYERSGSDWNTVERNIEKFIERKNSCSSMEIGVNITVSIQNVYYLPELVTWLIEKGVSHYHYNRLDQPNWLALKMLTPDAKKMVLEKLLSADLSQSDQIKLASIIQEIENVTPSDGQLFCEEMKKLDLIRSESFNLTHPEIAQAMGYML